MARSRGHQALRFQDGAGGWEAGEDDFLAAELKTSAELYESDPKELVHNGHFLWVVPVDMSPEDARAEGLDLMEAKAVDAIAWHARRRKYIFKCIDYVRADILKDCPRAGNNDPDTDTLFESLGNHDELVRTDNYSFIWQDRVEDFASVAALNGWDARFPPLFPLQPYARSDLAVTYMVTCRSSGWKAKETPHAYCHEGCVHERRYVPHEHEIRWCSGKCQRWYHVDCLGDGHKAKTVFQPGPHAGDFSSNWHEWDAARHKPIVREPRLVSSQYREVPFSLEMIFLSLRELRDNMSDNTDHGLPQLKTVIKSLANEQECEKKFVPSLIKDIKKAISTAPNDDLFRCIGEGCGEWI